MEIRIAPGEPHGGAVTVIAVGELDTLEADEFTQTVVGCRGPEVEVVVLDLGGVTYLGSLGIATLLRCRSSLAATGTALTISRYSDVVGRVLSVVGLLDRFAGPEDLSYPEDSESVG